MILRNEGIWGFKTRSGVRHRKRDLELKKKLLLTLYLIEARFNIFSNKEDPDQAALVRAV